LFATVETQLTHHMGDDVCYYWFLKKRRIPYRSPRRHYYIIRNSLLLQKRGYVPVAWKLSNLLKLCFTFVYFGGYSQDKAEQRKQMRYGVRDGFFTRASVGIPVWICLRAFHCEEVFFYLCAQSVVSTCLPVSSDKN
jgi:hypothetical protein